MSEKITRFHTILNNIDFRMIREKEKCWIKVVPLIRVSNPSSLHFILNDECYNFEIYDENGKEAHIIYFEGIKCRPNFYLKSGKNCYRICCNDNGIKVIPINKVHKQDSYIKENCHCISSQASCWANAVYYTSRPEKSPFDEM